ncbi:MAG: zinc ribbon domain-containing protein, partial [archaeon]
MYKFKNEKGAVAGTIISIVVIGAIIFFVGGFVLYLVSGTNILDVFRGGGGSASASASTAVTGEGVGVSGALLPVGLVLGSILLLGGTAKGVFAGLKKVSGVMDKRSAVKKEKRRQVLQETISGFEDITKGKIPKQAQKTKTTPKKIKKGKKHLCSECGAEVQAKDAKCNICQTKFEEPPEEKEKLNLCPNCGARIEEDWAICQACARKIRFKTDEEIILCDNCGIQVIPG